MECDSEKAAPQSGEYLVRELMALQYSNAAMGHDRNGAGKENPFPPTSMAPRAPHSGLHLTRSPFYPSSEPPLISLSRPAKPPDV